MAVIEGSVVAPIGSNVTTRDLYNISPNVDTYGLDYWFPHESMGVVPVNQLTETVGKNLPVETVTYTILAGSDILHTYFNDYYFRVHMSPSVISLGNVLTEQTINIELWNAYLSSNTLASIGASNSDGLTLTNPGGLTAYKPLEYRTVTLQVSPTGAATIDGKLTFNFNLGSIVLAITGVRAILWGFAPDTAHKETVKYLTDVIPAIYGETSLSLKEIPRNLWNYSFYLRTVEEFALAKNIAKTYGHIGLGIPVWNQIRPLPKLLSGSTSITIDTTYIEIAQGDLCIVYVDYKTYEILEVLYMTSSSIVLKQANVINFPSNCYFMPLKPCVLDGTIDFSRGAGSRNSVSVNFQYTKGFTSESLTGIELYNGLPVITNATVVENSLTENFSHKIEFLDADIGDLVPVELEQNTRHRQNIAITAHSQTDIFKLKRMLDYFKGRYNYFYLPTFSNDCIAISNSLSAGATFISVKDTGLRYSPPKIIRIVGNVTEMIGVSGVTVAGSVETIGLATNLVNNISNITSIQIVTKVRLDTDVIELNYDLTQRKYMTCKFNAPVLEVL
jgi:hypothetical protein